MTTPASPHEHWEELAAGFALHALEPDEEIAFRDHLSGCTRCQQVLDDHAFVAAQLGALAEDSEVTAPSWSQIRAGVVSAPPATAVPADNLPEPATAPVISLADQRDRRRPAARLLGAAAAAVILAGAGTAVWQLSGGTATNQLRPSAAIAACTKDPACHVVRLPEGHPKAVVLADADSARFVPTGLAAAGAGRVYALWQMPKDGRPVLVTVLPSAGSGRPGPQTRLALPYDETAAFAISNEPSDVVPTQPTHVVAVGTAGA
ncbi:MAG TPA: anti-sigma factor [Mycobacteriales bacterium]|nr:anti-sigma factor [Mycobacteriales bacterium]